MMLGLVHFLPHVVSFFNLLLTEISWDGTERQGMCHIGQLMIIGHPVRTGLYGETV